MNVVMMIKLSTHCKISGAKKKDAGKKNNLKWDADE